MSIDIYGFLGSNTLDLESRVIQSFAHLGFSAVLHPEINLLESNSTGCLYISFIKTPSKLKRVYHDSPLLFGFGYSVSMNTKKKYRSDGWPPKNVKQYEYEVSTRTSAGRSTGNYFAQALTVAILANETNGYFYINGDDAAIPGNLALERIIGELNSAIDRTFDLGAYPFEAWPPIDSNASFTWPEPIVSTQHQYPVNARNLRPKWLQFSVMEGLGLALLLYFLIVTIIYS